MLAEERFGQILNLLSKQRTATVQERCEALGTSESTIRRDLTELDRLGKLNKVHGGATLPDSRFQAEEPTMQAKETLADGFTSMMMAIWSGAMWLLKTAFSLIDDFTPTMRRDAVRIAAAQPPEKRIPLEVSGSVSLEGLRAIAEDGVDCISIGGLTKHVQAIDLSLKLGPPPG